MKEEFGLDVTILESGKVAYFPKSKIENKGTHEQTNILRVTRKYPLRGYILGSGAPGITLMGPLELLT